MGFLDFPFVADRSSADPRRFPGHPEVLRYLEEFARRFDLLGLVRFETEVVSVRRSRDDGAGAAGWRVSYRSRRPDGAEGELEEDVFDAVVVCNGHFTEPRVAAIAGIHCWPGKQMHSHNYRVPDRFRGQVVMVIGYQPSGMDISRDIAGVAKEVHVAMKSEPPYQMDTTTATGHANLWLHSCTIERAEEDGSLVFQDGSRIKADVILHCTGYKYSFPFLGGDDDGELAGAIFVDDNRVGPLYKHVFPPILAPHISFIGLPFRTIPFLVFQLQSKWVAGVLSGRLELPSQEAMMRDVDAFYSDMEARGCPRRRTHDLGQGNLFEYEDWVAEQCGLWRMEGWRKGMFVATCKNLADRPNSYRDEWDDDHLLPQAHQDFSKHSCL
ncbi:unnamed protein product [Triticum turgidum subsp. durum]|uniref:Flavin-containing monooxygenase n=1 Tax=Triticum turgidum subsp. durum TaxID=4567 RepID=A0A9R0WWE8_TRITD|nr:unnamed protein product [Triticum turgidum subsp. durum]